MKSTKLEVHLFVKGMKSFKDHLDLKVDESCTNAHQTIKSIMGVSKYEIDKVDICNYTPCKLG